MNNKLKISHEVFTDFARHVARKNLFIGRSLLLNFDNTDFIEADVKEEFGKFIREKYFQLSAAKSSLEFNKSGSKYLREVACSIDGKIDVYAVIDAFDVKCPARAHAIKKLLCSGVRGKGDVLQDLNEAKDAIERAIQMQIARKDKC